LGLNTHVWNTYNATKRVGDKTASDVLEKANLNPKSSPKELTRENISKLLKAFKITDFLPPPTDCLSPIGEELIMKSLMAEYKGEWVKAITRKPKVYSGHPFIVEAGIVYGGEITSEKVTLLRYSNKIPLIYQQGGCSITKAVINVNWKAYGLQQSKNELPYAPAVIMVHVASTNVPYTSESKEAISHIPEIADEIRLALQELGRRLNEYVGKKARLNKKKKKEDTLNLLLPLLAKKVSEILGKDSIDVDSIVAKIIGKVYIERILTEDNGYIDVCLTVNNFSKSGKNLKIYEMCSGEVEAENAKITPSSHNTLKWEVSLEPGGSTTLNYKVKGKIVNKKPLVEGVDIENLAGGEVINTGF